VIAKSNCNVKQLIISQQTKSKHFAICSLLIFADNKK